MTTFRGFPATNGPATTSAASGGWLLGVMFSSLGQMSWLDGYWVWNPSNGDTTARKCALWNIYANNTQQLVSGSVVTSGAFTQNAWNFVQLPSPIQLAPGELYCAVAGWTVTNGIPVTSGYYTTAGPAAGGISNGPLQIWSATAGGGFPAAAVNYNYGQGLFSNSLGGDPAVAMPNNGSSSNNLWVDVQLDTVPPPGFSGSYRFWPNALDLGNFSLDTANNFTLGLEFLLAESCAINNIWFYSPATVTQLPTAVGVYRVSDQVLVASNTSPSWSGVAGSGWMHTPLTGNLAPGVLYKAVVFNGAGSPGIWNAAVPTYWSTGFGINGLVSGPLTAPNDSTATSPGQESYNLGTPITFPTTSAGPFRYGTDIEVTPVSSGPGLLLSFFP